MQPRACSVLRQQRGPYTRTPAGVARQNAAHHGGPHLHRVCPRRCGSGRSRPREGVFHAVPSVCRFYL
jgi:hypothetical protein